MNWLPLLALYAVGAVCVAIMSKMNTIDNKRRMKNEAQLQQEKERHLERWRLFLNFMRDCHAEGEYMMEIMWLNKCSQEEAIVDRINEKLLNL